MNESNGGIAKKYVVLAVHEDREEGKGRWKRIGVAFPNRDGSTNILLDALPIGTNKLQVREDRERDSVRGPSARSGALAALEARP